MRGRPRSSSPPRARRSRGRHYFRRTAACLAIRPLIVRVTVHVPDGSGTPLFVLANVSIVFLKFFATVPTTVRHRSLQTISILPGFGGERKMKRVHSSACFPFTTG